MLTYGLRYIYRVFYHEYKSIISTVLAIIFSSAIILLILGPLEGLIRLPVMTPETKKQYYDIYRYFDVVKYFKDNIFWYVLILLWSVLYFGIKLWIDLADSKVKAEKASLLAQKSQLQMLRYQLNPHFLFNSLSSIQALIYDNPKAADKMLIELSEFLRFSLHDKDKLFIPLSEEISIVEKYLSMEKTRFPDRLDYTIEVSEMAAEREVVAFILQPFVENAVKYGMKTSPEHLRIGIRAYAEADRLYLEVMNSGTWVEENSKGGTGIRNVFERLQNAYSDRFRFFISKEEDRVTVTIEIISIQ